MFLESVLIVVREGQEPAFEVALCEVRRRVFTAAGFRGFAVAQGADDPSTYLIQVRWESAAELADFTESGRFDRCWDPVRPFLDRSLLVDHFVERPGLASQGPGTGADLDLAWMSG